MATPAKPDRRKRFRTETPDPAATPRRPRRATKKASPTPKKGRAR